MKSKERVQGLLKSPRLLADVLLRGRYEFIYDQMRFVVKNMPFGKRLNLARGGLNLVHRRLSPWSMPLHMQFEITNYCNLRCPVCPVGTEELSRPKKAMDVDLFESVMDEVGPYLLTASLWAWGEPLLHRDIHKILAVANRHNIVTLLSTNGQLFKKQRVIEALVNEPPTHLIVAIDGLTDETNSRFRVGAKLEPILEGVKRIAQIKEERNLQFPIIHMRFIVMQHNQHEVAQLEAFAKANHFDLLTIRTLSIIDTEKGDKHRSFNPTQAEFQSYDYENDNRAERDDFICQEPFWFPTVFADGTVVACEQDYRAQQAFGKVSAQTSFRELWLGKRAEEIRKTIRDNPQCLSFCQSCPYKDRASSDCSISAHGLRPEMDFPTTIDTLPIKAST